ncbi:MAG: histidine kinase dimerization/phosphoacceptor domain -containing protein [Bacteroidota bacterium]
MTLNFHKQFEELSRLPVNEADTLDDVLYRLGQRLSACLKLERVNVWVFKQNPSRIECIANYESFGDSFSKGEILLKNQIPSYFAHLMSDRAIPIPNVYTNEISAELKDSYCVDNRIMSILDIPVRIEGKLAGVICFEDCKNERSWTEDEINFAMAVSQIVSLSIENYKRRNYEVKLKKALEEKNTLLIEMHHRIKNNLTMLISLLRIQSRTIDDPGALEIFTSFENQILSISKLHEQLYITGNYLKVDLKSYLQELSSGLSLSMSNPARFDLRLEEVLVKSGTAVTIGLIVNEIINNSLKHGLKIHKMLTITIELFRTEGVMHLKLSDNGQGFNMPEEINSSFGLSLIHDLSEQISADIIFTSNSGGTMYELRMVN